MKFWPFERYEIRTARTLAEIEDCLKEVTVEDIFSFAEGKIFWGKIKEKSFKISRMLFKPHRNSYKPILKGLIEANGPGSIVRVKMRMSLFAMVVSLIILSVGLLITPVLVRLVASGESPLFWLILIPFILFGYVFPMAAYSGEAKRSRAILNEILEGRSMAVPASDVNTGLQQQM